MLSSSRSGGRNAVYLAPHSSPLPRPVARRPAAVGIGVSTGGPASLNRIINQFPGGFRSPIFLVQHMPPVFTRLFAQRLNRIGPLAVKETQNGEIVEPGKIYVAPGDYHMRVESRRGAQRIALDQAEPQNACRPAVDVLFNPWRNATGARWSRPSRRGWVRTVSAGAKNSKPGAAHIVVQDEASSVVWGMPGAVVRAGIADEIVALDDIIPTIVRRF